MEGEAAVHERLSNDAPTPEVRVTASADGSVGAEHGGERIIAVGQIRRVDDPGRRV